MDINKRDLLLSGLTVGAGLAASSAVAQPAPPAAAGGPRVRGGIDQGATSENSGIQPSTVDLNYKPRRVNKMIELWEDGQPIYYTHDGVSPDMTADEVFEHGKKMAKTYCDGIEYNVEHGPLDFTAFANFMQGLKAGGPTKSGHATPAVWVIPPIQCLSEEYALANSWVIGNFLDLGAHGISIVHSRSAAAMEVYAQQAARYPFDYPNTPSVGKRQGLGLRGAAAAAPAIWGITGNKYLHVADVWPLNPRGEIMIGVKIEDKFAVANAAEVLAVKGICFGEVGQQDNVYSMFGLSAFPENQAGGRGAPGAGAPGAGAPGAGAPGAGGPGAGGPGAGRTPEQEAAFQAMRNKVVPLFNKNKIMMFDAPPRGMSFEDQLKAGGMIFGGNSEDRVRQQREFTKRKMPV